MGLETAFPVLYTKLVRTGVLSLEKLIDLMAIAPRKRFSLPTETGYCVWDLHERYTVDPVSFRSKGRATPFAGWEVFGRLAATMLDVED